MQHARLKTHHGNRASDLSTIFRRSAFGHVKDGVAVTPLVRGRMNS
jgi:hypothetical protein